MIEYPNNTNITKYHLVSQESNEALQQYAYQGGMWMNTIIANEIVFSHRINEFDLSLFPDQLKAHNYYEIVIIQEGHISYIVDQYSFSKDNGQIIIIPPNHLHCTKKTGDCIYNRYVLYFTEEAFHLCGKRLLPPLLSDNMPHQLQLNSLNMNKCLHDLVEIEAILSTLAQGSSLLAYSKLISFIFFLTQISEQNALRESLLPDNFLKIKKYIDKNYCDIASVNEIAVLFAYSREYISRLFKRHLNVSILEYILICKMEEAKRLLINNSVTDTAMLVGYSNTASFIIAFKKRYGITPGQYKSKYSHM